GAARTGAGLVCVATPESVGMRLIGEVPELTMLLLQEEAAGLIGPIGWRRLSNEAVNYDATVIGPGLGRQPSTLRRTRHLIDELRTAAMLGVALRGAAGRIAERRIGRSGTMARDIANLLPEAAESIRSDRDR